MKRFACSKYPNGRLFETLRPPLKMAANLPKVEPVKVIPPVVPAQAIQPVPRIPKTNTPPPPKPR